MKFIEAKNSIGKTVHLNGSGDLAFDGGIRKYVYPKPKVIPLFKVVKLTRGGRFYIQCCEDGKFFTVNARNLDSIEESPQENNG